MSTWAARLSTAGKSPAGSRQASAPGTPEFSTAAGPSPPPPLPEAGHSFTRLPVTPNSAAYDGERAGRQQAENEEELRTLREEFRTIAERRNADADEVPVLKLPADVWELLTCFLSYTDVFSLAHVCRVLHGRLLWRDSVWEQQLRFFHEDILDMRGGALLMMDFAFPAAAAVASPGAVAAAATAAVVPGWLQFCVEKRLYVMDAHREWHFKELSSLEDKDTGVFTVALHKGHETRQSRAAAPLSREGTPASLTSGSADVLTSPGAYSSVWSQRGSPSPSSGAASPTPAARMPTVGAPFIGGDLPYLPLRILRPLRPGEALDAHGDANENGDDSHDALALGPPGAAGGGESDVPSTGTGTGADGSRYALNDVPQSVEDEDALLRYALALSEAEAQGRPPPAPPFHRARRSPQTPVVTQPGVPPAPQPPALRPSELMTMVELINQGTPEQSRTPMVDVTARQPADFLRALGETLKGAKRRRLHLGNHHRAVLNNGYTTRNRSGRSAAARHAESPSSVSAPDGASSPAPPPINRILRHFTGTMLEITLTEAQHVARELMGLPQLIDDFVILANVCGGQREAPAVCSPKLVRARDTLNGATSASVSLLPPTRFFLLPELCPHGYVGLVIVDVVRLLVAVEKERTAHDGQEWVADEAGMRAGRLFVPGHGYNAQYYERDAFRQL